MMTRDEFGCFLVVVTLGMLLIAGLLFVDNDRNCAAAIQKYKSGDIVCVELNNELICRSAK